MRSHQNVHVALALGLVAGGLACTPTTETGSSLGAEGEVTLGMPDPTYGEWSPAGGAAPLSTPASRQPCAARAPLREAYFGDLHVHTAFSFDALSRGGFQTPDDAYRFARGEEIGLSPRDESGQPLRTIQLDRPLDFAAVTDHAEWLGEVVECTRPEAPAYDTPACRAVRGSGNPSDLGQAIAELFGDRPRSASICGEDPKRCRQGLLSAWERTQEAAERHYDRTSACSFTTFHAWEYTRMPGRSKAHRNVILRNEIVPELPVSWVDEPEVEGLWDKLESRCNNGGSCEALTIPHNPNISNGLLFTLDYGDTPTEADRARAARRAQIEPLVEMMQSKGESECRQGMYGVVGGEDELCDFEKVRYVAGEQPPDCEEGTGSGAMDGRGCQSRLDFVRYGLIEGLRQWQRMGVNPIRVGLIGSTDTHNGTPGAVDEYAYRGHNSNVDSSPLKRLTEEAYAPHRLRNPGGLVGLWAEENTRDALFDAMKRREAFATSGVRIRPRLFADWNLPADLCERDDLVATADTGGVPMGGVLPPRESSNAPVFAATALQDPGTTDHPGGLLQRIQMIKGWVGDDGLFHEAVYDIAGDAMNGADVSPDTCEPNGPGASSLCGTWTDPDFDPARPAVYYARILENPSCRWNARQCIALPAGQRPDACGDPETPWRIQERAWTSPIWYEPTD